MRNYLLYRSTLLQKLTLAFDFSYFRPGACQVLALDWSILAKHSCPIMPHGRSPHPCYLNP